MNFSWNKGSLIDIKFDSSPLVLFPGVNHILKKANKIKADFLMFFCFFSTGVLFARLRIESLKKAVNLPYNILLNKHDGPSEFLHRNRNGNENGILSWGENVTYKGLL